MPRELFSSRLRATLEALEICLLSPALPGEDEVWIDHLGKALEPVEDLLSELERRHRQDFDTISSRRPELSHRVESLRRLDVGLRELHRQLRGEVEVLTPRITELEPDEAALEEDIEALRDLGMKFVIGCRRQHLAVRTWYQEAFHRDIGDAD